jgi:ATP-dependent DNA ligase
MFQVPERCRCQANRVRNGRLIGRAEPPVGTKALAGKSLPRTRQPELRMAGRVSRRAKVGWAIRRAEAGALPDFVPPQLTALNKTAPDGGEWVHELKWDGYRMHARIDGVSVRLLTRTGLDWTDKYPAIVDALHALRVSQAYLDGELCAVSEGGLTSFSAMQAATDARSTEGLILVLFDLLFLDGEDLTGEPLRGRKERLEALLSKAPAGLQYSEHHVVSGDSFLSPRLQARDRGDRLEAVGLSLQTRRPRPLAQGQVPES